jgi:hypothetical protein
MRILRPEEIHLLRMGRPIIPANGGDSESEANTTTTNNTRNTAINTDKRNVASEEAVSVSGDGVVVDRSSQSTTNFSDTSNRSTNFSDTSDRSVVTTNTVTDFGAIGKMLETVGTVANRAIGSSEMLGAGAIDSLNKTGANSVLLALKAFDSAQAQSANAVSSSREVMGFAEAALNQSRAAFAEAKDGGTNKTMLIVGLAVVGAVGVAVAMRD